MNRRAELSGGLEVRQVDEIPVGRWCRGGHVAPATFQRNPPNPAEPMRFFRVSGNKGVSGIYCEACLVVANAMRRGEVAVKRSHT